MKEREKNIQDAFIRMREFHVRNAVDYTALPDAAANFVRIAAAITALENYAAAQTSGSGGRAVERKSVTGAAIRRKMKEISRTARALNINDEGFRRLFRVTDERNEQALLASAREFVTQGAKYKADFLRLGMPTSFVDDLNDDIRAFAQAASEKADAQTIGTGATAGIDEAIDDGMEAVTIVDAIMKNVYRDNAVKLSEWNTARHVKRSAQKSKPPGEGDK